MRNYSEGVRVPCVLVLMVCLQGVVAGSHCGSSPCVAKHENVGR